MFSNDLNFSSVTRPVFFHWYTNYLFGSEVVQGGDRVGDLSCWPTYILFVVKGGWVYTVSLTSMIMCIYELGCSVSSHVFSVLSQQCVCCYHNIKFCVLHVRFFPWCTDDLFGSEVVRGDQIADLSVLARVISCYRYTPATSCIVYRVQFDINIVRHRICLIVKQYSSSI